MIKMFMVCAPDVLNECLILLLSVYGFNTYETFQAASALWLKFSLYVPAYGGALSERLMRPAAAAREQARMQHSLETGQTASDSLTAKHSAARGESSSRVASGRQNSDADIRFAWHLLPPFGCRIMVKLHAA